MQYKVLYILLTELRREWRLNGVLPCRMLPETSQIGFCMDFSDIKEQIDYCLNVNFPFFKGIPNG